MYVWSREAVTLPPQIQTLVDQMVRAMGLHATQPASIEINMDRDGIVQDVKPKLVYRKSDRLSALRGSDVIKSRFQADINAPLCCGVGMAFDVITREYVCALCEKRVDNRKVNS